MKVVMKQVMKSYLKNPIFWFAVCIVMFGVFQNLKPYLGIHYITSKQEMSEFIEVPNGDRDVSNGYIPASKEQQRKTWEEGIRSNLLNDFKMSEEESTLVIKKLSDLEIEEACKYLEENYSYCGAIYLHEDGAYHQGTKEEINSYLKEKLTDHNFSYYFSRKFADFAGLYMGFFAIIMLSVLFIWDTRKHTYELLHTKSIPATRYVLGKIWGGFFICCILLGLLVVIFYFLSIIFTKESGFEIHVWDYIKAVALYILPNMFMIVCVYTFITLLFKNPLPAVPLLFLYMIYSNMGSRNAEGIYGYYGKPLAIMVRFPGRFFDTAPPPLVILNQIFLIGVSFGMILVSIQLWKRR